MSQFNSDLAFAKNEMVKWEKKVRLLEELISLEDAHRSETTTTSTTTSSTTHSHASEQATPKRRGRPAKAQSQPETSHAGKSMSLPALLKTIGVESNHAMTIEQISELVEQAGYKSEAADPGYMIYQSLYKLCKSGVFERDRVTRTYKYIGEK